MQLKPGGKITEPNDWNDPIRVIKRMVPCQRWNHTRYDLF